MQLNDEEFIKFLKKSIDEYIMHNHEESRKDIVSKVGIASNFSVCMQLIIDLLERVKKLEKEKST